MTTPMARPKPIDLTVASGISAKPANTEVMMRAAATTTRAPWPTPDTTASRAVSPCT